MSHRDADLRALNELLDEHADQLTDRETEAFASMRLDMTGYTVGNQDQLTERQREWVKLAHERICGKPLTRLTAGEIPRGREVATPPVLQNLPKRPPPRRREE